MAVRQSSPSRKRARKAATPRRRRSAEDAKREILDAAEARFAALGPAGIRLQEIARDVGVSHPAILHHFGSREDLMRAVVERAFRALREELLTTLAVPDPSEIDVPALIERVFETLGGHGQARLMAWLALSGEEPHAGGPQGGAFFVRETAAIVHAQRIVRYKETGRRAPPYEDTLFAILLTTLALIGDALLGEPARASCGLEDPAAGRRFRAWFSEVLVAHLSGESPDAPIAGSAGRKPAPGAKKR